MNKEITPGLQEQRFASYIESLAEAAGHADRNLPLKNYCTGLLLPGERKSVEPMAARLAPGNVRRMHQSLHHVVADAPWSDEAVLDRCLEAVVPAMLRRDRVVAWVVEETGFPKKGHESVGVARQDCKRAGKQGDCRIAVSLSLSTEKSSMPIAYRLFLPESWVQDRKRRKKTGVPDEVEFQTRPDIALDEIGRARQRGIPQGVVMADAGYGSDTGFRTELTKLEMPYVVGVQTATKVWRPGDEGNTRRPRKPSQRDTRQQPVSVKELAFCLPAEDWKKVAWRQGVKQKLQSRFAALRVRPTRRGTERAEAHPEEWLLMEWPIDEPEPTEYWLSTMPHDLALAELVHLAKLPWIVERDYQELKQELGLGHYEGRGWRGFHHHATLCIAAYGFLVAERSRFSPTAHAGNLELPGSEAPANFRPRGSPRLPRAV